MDRCPYCDTCQFKCGTKKLDDHRYERSHACERIADFQSYYDGQKKRADGLNEQLDFIASSVRPMFMEIGGKMTRLLVLDLGGADQKTRNEGFMEEVNAAMKEVKR